MNFWANFRKDFRIEFRNGLQSLHTSFQNNFRNDRKEVQKSFQKDLERNELRSPHPSFWKSFWNEFWNCHLPYRHMTPELTTRLPVHTSCPDTSGMHPTGCRMSEPLQKNLCIDYASEHDPAVVGYRFLFGPTLDDITCFIRAHSCPYASAIFYLMLSILYLSRLVPYETHS